MKNLKSLLLALCIIAYSSTIAQMTYWPLAPDSYNMSVSMPTKTPISNGVTCNGVMNGVYDTNNNLLFYISGNTVYKPGSATGLFNLPTPNNSYFQIGSEIAIAPVPGTCKVYYIIYSMRGVMNLGLNLYVKIDVSSGTPTLSGSVVQLLPFVSQSQGIAVSKGVSGSGATQKRFLFLTFGGNSLKRFDITSTGITNGQDVVNINTAGFADNTFDTGELELSAMGNKLAWGLSDKVYIISIDPLTGTYVPNSLYTKPSSSIAGLEFNHSGLYLFISAGGGVYKTITTDNSAPIVVPNTTQMDRSHLEMAKNGLIYGVRDNNGAKSLVGINTTNNALSPISSAYNLGMYSFFYQAYCLPDQIDGENYANFTGNPLVTIAGNNINGVQPYTYCNSGSMSSWYNCQAMSFNAWYSNGTPTKHQIEIYQLGTGISQCTIASGLAYNSGWVNGAPVSSVDLRTFTDANGKNLGNSSGRFMLKYSIQSACGVVSSLTSYLEVVGAVVPIEAHAADWTGAAVPGNALEWAFDPNDAIAMNTTGTSGYTHYWLAIFEQNGAQRFNHFNNWQWKQGTIPNNLIDLRAAWAYNTGYTFEPGGIYKIQFAVSNPCMTQWTVTEPTFIVGTVNNGGLRSPNTSIEQTITGIKLFPNPAQDEVTFVNLSEDRNYTVTIMDMSGREVLTQEIAGAKLSTSELSNGLYIVNVKENGNPLYTSKLSIVR